MLTLLVLFFLPTIIAVARGRSALGIFLLNFFLGWTVVFRWLALILAFTGGPRIRYVHHYYY